MSYSSNVSNKPSQAVPMRSIKKSKPTSSESASEPSGFDSLYAAHMVVDPQVTAPSSMQEILQNPQHPLYSSAPLYASILGFATPVNPVHQANMIGLARQLIAAYALAQKQREMEQVRQFLALQEIQVRSREAIAAVAAARSGAPAAGQERNKRSRDSPWYRNAAA